MDFDLWMYVDAHIWDRGWLGRERGWGEQGKTAHMSMRTHTITARLGGLRRGNYYTWFKKHLPRHLCAKNKAVEKKFFLPRQCG